MTYLPGQAFDIWRNHRIESVPAQTVEGLDAALDAAEAMLSPDYPVHVVPAGAPFSTYCHLVVRGGTLEQDQARRNRDVFAIASHVLEYERVG